MLAHWGLNWLWHLTRCTSRSCHLHLLVLDHDFEPLLKVFLHAHAAPFHEVLNSLNLCLELLELCIFALVLLLVLIDSSLQLVFLLRADQLTIIVNQATQCVLLPDLLDLVRQVFDLRSRVVHILA